MSGGHPGEDAAPWPGAALAAAPTDAAPPAAPAPGWRWLAVCHAETLVEGGEGVRFEVPGDSGPEPAFAVRARGAVRSYLNRCRHVPIELDWQPGRFFDDSGLYLICATHGATYRAVDGRCVGGPCGGQSLVALQACEHESMVWVAIRDAQA